MRSVPRYVTPWVLCGGVVVILAFAAACSGVGSCTDIGCSNAVTVVAPPQVEDVTAGTLRVCVNQRCVDRRFVPRTVALSVDFEGMNVGDVTVATFDMPDGRHFTAQGGVFRTAPNGERCGPICTVASLQLSAT